MNSRTSRILQMVTGERSESNLPSYSKRKELFPKKPTNDDGLPRYVELFDKGQWEELDKYLQLKNTLQKNEKCQSISAIAETSTIDVKATCKECSFGTKTSNMTGVRSTMEEPIIVLQAHRSPEEVLRTTSSNDECSFGLKTSNLTEGVRSIMEEPLIVLQVHNSPEEVLHTTSINEEYSFDLSSSDSLNNSLINQMLKKSEAQKISENQDPSEGYKKKFDRKNFCIYCQNLVTNYSRHIQRWHTFEKEVMEYMSVNDIDVNERKRKRRLITDDLRQRGNFLYNSQNKDFLPNRRNKNQAKSESVFDYLTCRFCLGMFKRRTFYLHIRNCNKKPLEIDNDTNESKINDLIMGNRCKKSLLRSDGIQIMPNSHGENNSILQKDILPIMKKDEVGLIAINDQLILSMGSQFLSSHREKKDIHNVTKKLRDAGRLLKLCMKDGEIKQFSDCLKPQNFTKLMEAVQKLCGLDKETGKVSVVGMAPRLSFIIQECAKILQCEIITNFSYTTFQKEMLKTEINDFLQLFKARWKYIISTNSEKSRKKNQATKEPIMPLDEDIKHLATKIRDLEILYYNQLFTDTTPVNYENLCKITIAHIIVLNRRRSGEVARAELHYYINRPPNDQLTPDVLGLLSEEEKQSLNELTIFMVPGKLVHTVPILLTENMKKNIDLIIIKRSALQIEASNRLLFARVCTENAFDGSKIIRDLRQQCGLKKTDHMTATGLRHHVATKSQIHWDEKYTENICTFLGHTKNIHNQNYRLPIQAIQKGQIGHRLLEMEGSDNQFKTTTELSGYSKEGSFQEKNNELERDDFSEEDEYLPSNSYQPGKFTRKRWTEKEKSIVLTNFGKYVREKKNPGMQKCLDLIRAQPLLATQTWQQLNSLVNNFVKSKTKLPREFSHLEC